MLISVVLYQLQRSSKLYTTLRPFVIFNNILTLIWFLALQYYRFKDTGRACAGEFLTKYPQNFGAVYLAGQGTWLKVFTISMYVVYLVQKLVSIVITNRIEGQYEEQR